MRPTQIFAFLRKKLWRRLWQIISKYCHFNLKSWLCNLVLSSCLICLDFWKWRECQHYHPDTFPRKCTGFFLQSTTNSLSTHSLLTHLACVWLAGFRRLSLQGMSGQGLPAQNIGTFTEQKATLCDPPHPPGDNAPRGSCPLRTNIGGSEWGYVTAGKWPKKLLTTDNWRKKTKI